MARPDQDKDLPKKPKLFWWTLLNLLAIGFAIMSWVVCLKLFRDPTNPVSYDLMLKFGRLDPLASLGRFDVPVPHEVSDPLRLEAQFRGFNEKDRDTLNRGLLRAYITNYQEASSITYITGLYEVLAAQALTPDSFLFPGYAVKLQGLVVPDNITDPVPVPIFVHCLFPTASPAPPPFEKGEQITFEKLPDCAVVINVSLTQTEDDDDNALLLTVVPLHARTYPTPSGQTFEISPPERANLSAPLPIPFD